jgi:putative ABC transport system substrate-binding protein
LRLEILSADELEGAFKTAKSAGAGALFTIASSLLFNRARQLAELAATHRLPAMYDLRPYVEAGGLISYGADLDEIWRRAASFVDKFLKGTRAAEIPVEQPSTFELVLNLKTAKALGLPIPPSCWPGWTR